VALERSLKDEEMPNDGTGELNGVGSIIGLDLFFVRTFVAKVSQYTIRPNVHALVNDPTRAQVLKLLVKISPDGIEMVGDYLDRSPAHERGGREVPTAQAATRFKIAGSNGRRHGVVYRLVDHR
jgi:hypothetical protein